MLSSYNISNSCKILVSKIKQIWRPLVIGQVLSILLAASGAANDTLHFDCNLSAPSLQAGLIYLFLSFCSVGILFERRRMMRELGSTNTRNTRDRHRYTNSGNVNEVDEIHNEDAPVTNYENGGSNTSICRSNCRSIIGSLFPIEGSLKMYFVMATLDLEGNYFTYLAFRYTTLTSVSLLDALAIPSAMVFSKFFLRRIYRGSHYFGAIICILGVVVNVFVDFHADDNDIDQDDGYIDEIVPFQMRGDFYAVVGAIIYGLNDVLTERSVKHIGGVREYQAMIGIFGTIIALVQGLIFDKEAVQDFFNRDDDLCGTSKALSILLASGLFGVASYVGISNFLVESEAAFLNLSLLTGDLWAVGFSIVVQQIIPSSMFWVALVLIVLGVFIYELSKSPVVDEREDIHIDEGDFGHFRRNGLIQQRDEVVTARHLRELEMPDEII